MFFVPSFADTQTRNSSFTYDTGTGLLTSEVIMPSDTNYRVETDYTYDGYGHRITAAVSGQGITTRNTAAGYNDSNGQFQTSATNALQQSEGWTYDSRTGLPLTHTDLNGLVTSWIYDGFGRVTQETRPDGGKTVYSYIDCTASGSSCSITAAFAASAIAYGPDGSTITSPKTTVYYDVLSRQVGVETQGFDGNKILALTQYDDKGNVSQISRPYWASSGAAKWTVNTYDTLGRVTRNVSPNGGYATYVYHGLTATMTNDKGQTNVTTKDAQDKVAVVKDAAGNRTTYAYDAYGNLTTVTNPYGNQISNTYDTLGRKTASSDPDMGSWTYSYDVLGQMTTQTDAKQQTTTLSYDLLGRVVSRTEASQVSTWTYGTTPVNHDVGKVIEAKSCTASGCSSVISDRTVAYDGYGRPWRSVLSVDGTSHTYTTSYESAGGRPSTVAYPSGFTAQNVYNANGYLSQIKDASSGAAYWTANLRDAEQHLVSQTAGNGVTTSQTFDANTGLLTNLRAGPSDAVAAFDYQFDTLGNLTYRSDNHQGVFEYACYDGLNRITEYAVGNAVTACTSTQNHKMVTYDALGNITYKSDVGYYAYGARAHAVSSVTGTVNGTVNPNYAYDANGNMATGAGRTIAYTSFNMTASIQQGSTTIALSYDTEHARVKMVGPSGTTTYLNDPVSGAMAEKLVSGSSTTWHDYIQADGRIVAEKFSGATSAMRYFVTDHLGSVTAATDESGAVVERNAYDAWGKRRSASDGSDDTACALTSLTTRGFTGHEEIDAACLINANARIYDPALGKFLAGDSMVPDPYDSQSYNRYTYVRNRPLSATDPTGHIETVPVYGCQSCLAQQDALQYNFIQTLGFYSSNNSAIMNVSGSVTGAFYSHAEIMNNIQAAIGAASKSSAQSGNNQQNEAKRSVIIQLHTDSDGTVTGTYSIVNGDADAYNKVFSALGIPNFGGGEIGSSETNGSAANDPKIPNLTGTSLNYLHGSGNTLSGSVRLRCTLGEYCGQITQELNVGYHVKYGNGFALNIDFALVRDSDPFDLQIVQGSCRHSTAIACAGFGSNTMTATGLYNGQSNIFNHEFGHILGFGHSSDSGSMMYYTGPYSSFSGFLFFPAYDRTRLNMNDATRLINEYRH